MKTPGQVLDDVARRLSRTWASEAAGVAATGDWPHDFSLGAQQGAELDRAEDLFSWVRAWSEWLDARSSIEGLALRSATRVYRTTRQTLPTHLTVPTAECAARLRGGEWPARLRRANARFAALVEHCPASADAAVLKVVDGYSDVDFELLLAAIDWFAANPSSGFTPREVPIAGIHSKWLGFRGRRELICRLARLDDLGLSNERPHAVAFTYLDREHRAAAGRVYDSVVPGDHAVPAYQPRVIVVCENRDSALFFPELPGGIAIQGAGYEGPARLRELLDAGWLPAGAQLIYWGDIDAHGFEIVNGYRERGLPIETILMDITTLRQYAMYGVNTSPTGAPLQRGQLRPLPKLTDREREAYEAVSSASSGLPARLEQERIPLGRAVDSVANLGTQPARERIGTP